MDTVAAAAGVSTATISRYFSSPERLRQSTAARVREVVNRLGYVPNLLAGGLSSARTQLVAAIIPSLSNSIFSSTLQAINDTLTEQGYSVVFGLTGASDQHVERQLHSIIGRRPDGIILTGTSLTPNARAKLKASDIPIIETWDLPRVPIDMAVGFSHEAVGRAIGEHVVRSGRRQTFIVSAGGVRALARRYGLSQVLLEHAFPEPVITTFPGITTYGLGRRAVAEHLDAGGRPDAILCSSDWAAHGALDELRRRGIRVPSEVAVIGFGDLDFAAELDPPLTTVKIDGRAIGERATEYLMRRARGQRVRSRVVDVGFELIVRASG
jgi:LacI family transcriptional regulator, gluconate utilization system Gnt-I transcriptional repressor